MSIESAAAFVAHTELALEAARETEAHARAAAEGIAERIVMTERKKQKIRVDIAAERIDEAQAAGMFGLAEADLRDLAELHREALARLGEAVRQTQAAQTEQHSAVAELAKAESAAKFSTLTDYAAKLDGLLVDAVSELARLSRAAGRPTNGLTGFFRPSGELANMIRLGQIPSRKARA